MHLKAHEGISDLFRLAESRFSASDRVMVLEAQQCREVLLIQFIDALADVVRKHKMRADKPIRLSVSVR